MLSAIVAFASAMLAAVILTPAVRRFARELGVLDRPSERRVHAVAIPRLGGIAIAAAFFVPLLWLFAFETEVAKVFFAHPMRMLGLTIGGLLVCCLGVLDDVRGVRAWHKLWVQVVAACVAYLCGFRIDAIALPLFGHLEMGIFAVPITVLWIVAIINAINLIDGLDGLAGGVAFFACVSNFVVGAINHDPVVMLLSASLGGALLGFLLYNFNPASIFMGDSGSMFLGFTLATSSLLGSSVKSSTTVAILVPLVALGLPIMDTLFAMMRRFLERRPIFAADKGHIHHQLLAMGLTQRRAVLLLYALSIAFTAGAVSLSMGRNWQVGAALLILSVAIIGVVRAMGNLQVALGRWLRRERIRSAAAEVLRKTVPHALVQLHGSRDMREVAAILRDFAESSGLTAVELQGLAADNVANVFQWERAAPAGSQREVVTSSYPVAAAGVSAQAMFSWPSEQGDLGAEAEILLQLLVDAWNARLARVDSEPRRVAQGAHLQSMS